MSGLSNLRFEGLSNEQLAVEVDGLRNGAGSESLHRAVRALMHIADALADTDRTLRGELAKIGVEWEGAASERGHEETQQASIYAEEAVPRVAQSAGGVGQQGDAFSHSRNGAPDSGELRGPTQLNGIDRFAGMLGHTTDNARKVEETQAARQQAIGSLNNYQRGSQSALDNHQSLPVPPGMGLVAQPTDPQGMTSAQSANLSPGAYSPTGGGPGVPATGTTGPFGGNPNQLGYTGTTQPGPGGQPGLGQGNPLPGRTAGIGPVGPNIGGMPPGGALGLPRPGFPMGMIGDAGALAGLASAGAGGAAAGAALPKDRLVRGGGANSGGAAGANGKAGAGAGGANGKAGAGADGPDARARGGSAMAGAPDEGARAARAAERLGGTGGRPGGSLMSPAAAAGGAQGEDDEEHVRKYGIDSDDVFGDDRLVIDAVLGGDDPDR
ncbi:hypothetical protein ACTG9Q_02125 [Actinokineospora sp. 24-640]